MLAKNISWYKILEKTTKLNKSCTRTIEIFCHQKRHKTEQAPTTIKDILCSLIHGGLVLLDENSDDFDRSGIAGLIIGLGMSVGAIYRTGKKDAVVKIKTLIVSCIPYADSPKPTPGSNSKVSVGVFSVGACLAIPIIITFCQKVELFDAHEVDHLINCFNDLNSELLIVKKSSAFHKILLMASCIGAGDLLDSVLNEGIHPVVVESVKGLLELFKTCYSGLYPPVVHFGGMLGVVNVLGGGAGNLVYSHPLPRAPHSISEENVKFMVYFPRNPCSLFAI